MAETGAEEGAGDGPSVGVAVPAAGAGRRMGGRPKQYGPLAGEPVLLHALRPFLDHPAVTAVAVALPEGDAARPPPWLRSLDPRVRLVAGGATRRESVGAAVEALPDDVDLIVIHDAARPLVTRGIIDRCLAVAAEGEGAVAGWPAVDTLKAVDGEGRIVDTPAREGMWQAQTPQAFPASLLRDAYRRAAEEGWDATDDSALVGRMGGAVRMVRGEPWNLKITHDHDRVVAEALLEARSGGGEGGGRAAEAVGTSRGGDPEEGVAVPAAAAIRELVAHLQGGGLLVHPTETVYGLGGLARGPGLEELLRRKERGPERPVLLLVTGPEMVSDLEWTPLARSLARTFWPGPLTLVLPDPARRYPPGVRSAAGGVAVRQTSHTGVQRLLRALGEPLTSTSANPPGEAPARTVEEALAAAHRLGNEGRWKVLDGGRLAPSEPSTVVECVGEAIRILREGALPEDRVRRAVTTTGGTGHEFWNSHTQEQG